jgi:hypothetical protein
MQRTLDRLLFVYFVVFSLAGCAHAPDQNITGLDRYEINDPKLMTEETLLPGYTVELVFKEGFRDRVTVREVTDTNIITIGGQAYPLDQIHSVSVLSSSSLSQGGVDGAGEEAEEVPAGKKAAGHVLDAVDGIIKVLDCLENVDSYHCLY